MWLRERPHSRESGSGHAVYDLVMLLQTSERFSQPWTIAGTVVTYRVGNGPSQTLRVGEQVQVE